jgi:hypothetical protein
VYLLPNRNSAWAISGPENRPGRGYPGHCFSTGGVLWLSVVAAAVASFFFFFFGRGMGGGGTGFASRPVNCDIGFHNTHTHSSLFTGE